MKPIFIAIAAFFLVVANSPLDAFEITKNEAYLGITAEQVFSDNNAVQGYTLTVPYVSHSFEANLTEQFVFTIDSEVNWTIEKVEMNAESGNSINVSSAPALKWSPIETISLNETLSFEFSNYKPGELDTERENFFELGSSTEFAYSTLEEELPGISPWEQFQKGWKIVGRYAHQLYSKDAGEKAEELDYGVGFDVRYAYFNESSAFMVMPSFVLLKHLNDQVDESLEMDVTLTTAKDLTNFLTGTLDVNLNMVKPDADTNLETELALSVNAILNKIEKVSIAAGANYRKILSGEETDSAYGFSVGIEYTLFAKE